MSRTLVRNRLCISDDDFVIAYCKAPHVAALIQQLNVPAHTVRNRIIAMRKKGVELPAKPRAPRTQAPVNPAEIERLNKLIQEHQA